MTWLFVTTSPDGSMMKPEPSEVARRGTASGLPCGWLRSKKSLKNSSKGEPGGNCGTSGPTWPTLSLLIVCVVETLTTAGRSFAARSAKLSGAGLAMATPAGSDNAATTASAMTTRERRGAERSIRRAMDRLTNALPRAGGARMSDFTGDCRRKPAASGKACKGGPDGRDAKAGGDEATHSERAWRQRHHLCHHALHPFGEERIEHALDDQDERKRRGKVLHDRLSALRRLRRRAEVAEKLAVGRQHEGRVLAAERVLVGLERAVEGEEVLVPPEGVGRDLDAVGIALTLGDLRRLLGFGQDLDLLAVGAGGDLLRQLVALGPELRCLALAIGFHAHIDGVAVGRRQVDAAQPHVGDGDAEGLRLCVDALVDLLHRVFALARDDVGELHVIDRVLHAVGD